MGVLDYIGAVFILVLIVAIGVMSGRKVKSGADFASGGGKAGKALVAGMILGTIVGGSSTVGTVQLAYTNGLSAWWFTLGAGIGCLLLGLFFVGPFRRSGCMTLMEMIQKEFGERVGMTASILCSVGIYINIISQMLSATAIVPAVFPGMGAYACLALAAGLMLVYVIFGGALGAGVIGLVKLVLLYAVMALGTVIVLSSTGLRTLYETLDKKTYFNLFSRGVWMDGGNGLSLVFGILTTQSYAQAVLAGRTDRDARVGTLVSACMIPPLGAAGILIGEFMRVHHPELASAKDAFSAFVLTYMPNGLSGIVLATMLITVVGTGAGLALGVSTIVTNDIVKHLTRRFDSPQKSLLITRLCLVAVLASVCALSTGRLGDVILTFAFMSMGLRSAVVMVPLLCALFLPGKVDRHWMLASVILGPLLVLVFGLWKVLPVDSLFVGMAAAGACGVAGYVKGKGHAQLRK